MADANRKRKRATVGSTKKSREEAPDLTKLVDTPDPSLSSAQSSESPTAPEKVVDPKLIVKAVVDPNSLVIVTGKVTKNVLVGKGCYVSLIKGKRTKVKASATNHLKRMNFI